MTGESQPGERPPAPGRLALVQAFINSHYDLEQEHGADLFAAPESLSRWLQRHAPGGGSVVRAAPVAASDMRRAVDAREALRTLARDGVLQAVATGTLATLNRALDGAVVAFTFGADGPSAVPAGRTALDQVLGAVAAATAAAIVDGTWTRLKICPGEACDWAFYDHSRNLSGRWCSMRVCGGRAKARAHYVRQRQAR